MSSREAARGVKIYAIVLTMLAVVAGGAAAYALLFRSPFDDSATTTSMTNQVADTRYEYQEELNVSEKRFTPGFDMIVFNGRAYIRTDYALKTMIGHCDIRCGTVEKVNGSWRVSLPVGYAHGSNVAPEPKSWEPVTSLTYWHPLKRRVENVTAEKGVILPEVLRGNREAADLKPGETAYTTADFVREDSTGKTYMINGVLAYELLGKEYGYVIDTAVTRRWDGVLEVKLPEERRPLSSNTPTGESNIVPVVVR